MFNLIRRISYGVIPRADRPWEEDPTSNAPNTKRKRRLSETEREVIADDEKQANAKKARGESATASDGVASTSAQLDTKEVKEVTKGVDEVHLDGKDEEMVSGGSEEVILASASVSETPVAPENVPLPEDAPDDFVAGSTPPAVDEDDVHRSETGREPPSSTADDASDIASSSGEGEDADGESVPDADPELTADNITTSTKHVPIEKTIIPSETAAQA